MIPCLSGRTRLSLELPQLCHTGLLRVYSWKATRILSLGSRPQSLSLSIQPLFAKVDVQTAFWLGSFGWQRSLWWTLYFVFQAPVACSPLGFQISTCPYLWGSFRVCRKCFSFIAPFPRHRSLSQILCLFTFFISFALHHSVEFSLLFGSLGVQVFYRGWSYADVFLMYLWEGRWYTHLTLLPSCVGLSNRL